MDVPRNVNLRYDGNSPATGVVHHLSVVFLGEVATGRTVHLRLPADLRQFGPRLDLDPPALVVAQVEVKVIDLVRRDPVDDLLDGVDAEKRPGDVQHVAPVGKAGLVRDRSAGEEQPAVGLATEGSDLIEGNGRVEDTGFVARDHADGLRADVQQVRARGQTG